MSSFMFDFEHHIQLCTCQWYIHMYMLYMSHVQPCTLPVCTRWMTVDTRVWSMYETVLCRTGTFCFWSHADAHVNITPSW